MIFTTSDKSVSNNRCQRFYTVGLMSDWKILLSKQITFQ